MKQTASLYLKLPLKPTFFKNNKKIVIFGKLSLLSLFLSEYLDRILKKQPLGGVPKNRCSYFPGYIQTDMNTLILLEQVHFPGGQQY